MSEVEETPADVGVEEEEEEEEEIGDDDEEVVPVACCSCSLNSKCLRCVCHKLGGCRPSCPSRKCLYKERAARAERAAAKRLAEVETPAKSAKKAKTEVEVETQEKEETSDVNGEDAGKEATADEDGETQTEVKIEEKEEAMDTSEADVPKQMEATVGEIKKEAEEPVKADTKKPAAKKAAAKDKAPAKENVDEKKDERKTKEVDGKKEEKTKESGGKGQKTNDKKSTPAKGGRPEKKNMVANENFLVPTANEYHHDLDVIIHKRTLCIGPMDMSDLSNQDIYDCLQKAETFYIRFEKVKENFVGYVDVQFFTEEAKDENLEALKKCGVLVEPVLSKQCTKAQVYAKVQEYSMEVKNNDDTCGLGNVMKRPQTVVLPGIQKDITRAEILEKFPKAKTILIPENEEGERRGYAYVEFETKEESEKVLETKMKFRDDGEEPITVKNIRVRVPTIANLLGYLSKHWITQKPNRHESISAGQKNRLFELNSYCKIYLHRRELSKDERTGLEKLQDQIKRQIKNYNEIEREKEKTKAARSEKTKTAAKSGTNAKTSDKLKNSKKSATSRTDNRRNSSSGRRTTRFSDIRNRTGGRSGGGGPRRPQVQSLLNMRTPPVGMMGPQRMGNMGMGNMGMDVGGMGMGMGMNNMGGGMNVGMGNNMMGNVGAGGNRVTPLLPNTGAGILGAGPGSMEGNMGGMNQRGMGMGMGAGGGMGMGMGAGGGMGMGGGGGIGMGGGGGMGSGGMGVGMGGGSGGMGMGMGGGGGMGMDMGGGGMGGGGGSMGGGGGSMGGGGSSMGSRGIMSLVPGVSSRSSISGGGAGGSMVGRTGMSGSSGQSGRSSAGSSQTMVARNVPYGSEQRRTMRQDNYRNSRQMDARRPQEDDGEYFVGGGHDEYDSREQSGSQVDDKYDEYGSTRRYGRDRREEWDYEGGSNEDRGTTSRSHDDRDAQYSGAYPDYKSGYGRDSDNYSSGDRSRSSGTYGRGSESGRRQDNQRHGGGRLAGGDRGESVKDQVHKAAADANLDPSAAVNLLVGLSNILKGNLDVSSLVRESSQQRAGSGGRSSGSASRGGVFRDSGRSGGYDHGDYQNRY